MKKNIIEYSILGIGIEEHFDTKKQMIEFYKNELSDFEKNKVQCFSKKWKLIDGQYEEDEVIIYNY